MWTRGEIIINGIRFKYWVKHFDEGSKYGIDDGKISKLEIKRDGEYVVHYDRGWDIYPSENLDIQVYEGLLREFN